MCPDLMLFAYIISICSVSLRNFISAATTLSVWVGEGDSKYFRVTLLFPNLSMVVSSSRLALWLASQSKSTWSIDS